MTPIDFLKYVRSLPMDATGEKIDRKTREVCGMPVVATIGLIGISGFTKEVQLCEVRKVTQYHLSPSTMDGLVAKNLVRVIPSDGLRKWKVTSLGVEESKRITADLSAFIKQIITKKS